MNWNVFFRRFMSQDRRFWSHVNSSVVGHDSTRIDCRFGMYTLKYVFWHSFIDFSRFLTDELKLSWFTRKHDSAGQNPILDFQSKSKGQNPRNEIQSASIWWSFVRTSVGDYGIDYRMEDEAIVTILIVLFTFLICDWLFVVLGKSDIISWFGFVRFRRSQI